MYTTHNFKMLYVYMADIMGGLHASDLVVLMYVSQTPLYIVSLIFHLLIFMVE